ncbi:beta-galactosidase [Paenibacillus massiliensis]|uniref:beta-galactosidase n=1 Tax=Paenibacillus massiliensis TaxID=225917 RepID=UPI0006842B13
MNPFEEESQVSYKPEKLYYGVAYYDEYMPYDRLEEDIALMKDAGINLVRIAESTWSTHEPQDGVFDFSSVDRVLEAMHRAGIDVIVGTPTYAVPTWLVKAYPEVLAVTKNGPGRYGARQIMDITSPVYLRYAERIIRKLIARVAEHPAVIGFQVDNETKHYGTVGPNVQFMFVKYMKDKFNGDLDQLNHEYGLDYWSNRINSWEDFPSVVGTINGSLGAEFSRFQRQLVTDFLAWQVELVREYAREDQFVTHNFDFEWRGYSYGIQPDVNHFEASKVLDVTGVDIYHPSQGELTGLEISFGGDIIRSTKHQPYFVLETEAQAFKQWVPYPGQLRQQAYSHLASGAVMVEYWHWHSIHNSAETYWKGLLSHDLRPNPVYNEAKIIGREFAQISARLTGLRKQNKVGMVISNESHTALEWFPFAGRPFSGQTPYNYNDVFRLLYDQLYRMNIGVDILNPENGQLEDYDLIVVPPLYTVPDSYLQRLNRYVEQGGHVVYAFKSGFTDENVKVRTVMQPGIISEACGATYQLFVEPRGTRLKSGVLELAGLDTEVKEWMELLVPEGAEVLASYDHPHWGEYAAITRNRYGKGSAAYIGCFTTPEVIRAVLEHIVRDIGLWGADQELSFPVIVKHSVNEQGQQVHFYFNYSDEPLSLNYTYGAGHSLLSDEQITQGQQLTLESWGTVIIEEQS